MYLKNENYKCFKTITVSDAQYAHNIMSQKLQLQTKSN